MMLSVSRKMRLTLMLAVVGLFLALIVLCAGLLRPRVVTAKVHLRNGVIKPYRTDSSAIWRTALEYASTVGRDSLACMKRSNVISMVSVRVNEYESGASISITKAGDVIGSTGMYGGSCFEYHGQVKNEILRQVEAAEVYDPGNIKSETSKRWK